MTPRDVGLQPLENKALSWGIIGKSAPILAETTIRKSQNYASPALPLLPRDKYHPTGEDPPRQATLLLPRDGMRRAHFPVGLQLLRSLRRDQATDRRHGDERRWHSGYRSRAACQSHHRHQRT